MWNAENDQFPCKATAGWVQDFRKKHKIRQTHSKQYINSKGNATFEEKLNAAETFKKQIVNNNPTSLLLLLMHIKDEWKQINAKIKTR